MNQQAVQYLQQNKNNFSKEELINELKKSGYSNQEIDSAVGYVYEGKDLSADAPPLTNKSKIESEPQIDTSATLSKKSDKDNNPPPIVPQKEIKNNDAPPIEATVNQQTSTESVQPKEIYDNNQNTGMSTGSKIALVVIIIAILLTIGIIVALMMNTTNDNEGDVEIGGVSITEDEIEDLQDREFHSENIDASDGTIKIETTNIIPEDIVTDGDVSIGSVTIE
jgi:hypothetical protein